MAKVSMRSAGWVWEGQGLDPGVHPSVFGAGDGARWFGLRRAHYLFQPNSELAMEKLRGLDEIVCDISKWTCTHGPDGAGSYSYADASFESVRSEAANVGRLSLKYPYVTGAIHDDMKGLIEREKISPQRYVEIHKALKQDNPKLKLWSVVYTHELSSPIWKEFMSFIDVVNLWVWKATDLPTLDDGLERCRELFGPRPIVIGCYLRDYTTRAGVPMHLLRFQWERVAKYLTEGKIAGYAILATVLIDVHEEQARWARDFIAAH